MKQKKILITGGLGFLGKSLAGALLKRKDNQVIILDNFQGGKIDSNTNGSLIIKGDVRCDSDWAKIPAVDYVYHFAAPSSITMFDKDMNKSIQTTLSGMLNCVDWSLRNKVKKIIYPSSGSVYGDIDTIGIEDGRVNPINIYGKTKLECERIAQLFQSKIPLLGLRIFAGFGPQEDQKGKYASVITLFMRSLLKKESPIVYGTGMQTRDFIYIDDIVNVFMQVLTDNSTGVLNVGSGKKSNFNQIIACLNKLLGTNIHAKYIPPPNNYLISTQADTQKLSKILPSPLSLEEGISRMIKC